MAAEPLSLLEFVHELLADAQLRGRFADDPHGTLHAYGLGALGPADVHDALVLAQDNEITDFRSEPAWDAGMPDDTAAFGHGAPVPHADPWAGGWDAGTGDWPDRSDPWDAGGPAATDPHGPFTDPGTGAGYDADQGAGPGGFGAGADHGHDGDHGVDHDGDPDWPDLHHG